MISKKTIKSNKSQVTIFIIIALIILVVIALLFVLMKKSSITPSISPIEEPRAYFENCIKDKTTNIEKEVFSLGGVKSSKSRIFEEINVSYICFTAYNEELCFNEHPMLISEMQEQILVRIKPEIEKCFSKLRSELLNNNYKETPTETSLEIRPERLSIKLDKTITFIKNEQTLSFSDFSFNIKSPAYDFARIASEAVNQEVLCNCGEESCGADTLQLSKQNRDFEISSPIYNEQGRIYIIKELNTGKEFNFAVRNCILNV